jgi:hypothetical protein
VSSEGGYTSIWVSPPNSLDKGSGGCCHHFENEKKTILGEMAEKLKTINEAEEQYK